MVTLTDVRTAGVRECWVQGVPVSVRAECWKTGLLTEEHSLHSVPNTHSAQTGFCSVFDLKGFREWTLSLRLLHPQRRERLSPTMHCVPGGAVTACGSAISRVWMATVPVCRHEACCPWCRQRCCLFRHDDETCTMSVMPCASPQPPSCRGKPTCRGTGWTDSAGLRKSASLSARSRTAWTKTHGASQPQVLVPTPQVEEDIAVIVKTTEQERISKVTSGSGSDVPVSQHLKVLVDATVGVPSAKIADVGEVSQYVPQVCISQRTVRDSASSLGGKRQGEPAHPTKILPR